MTTKLACQTTRMPFSGSISSKTRWMLCIAWCAALAYKACCKRVLVWRLRAGAQAWPAAPREQSADMHTRPAHPQTTPRSKPYPQSNGLDQGSASTDSTGDPRTSCGRACSAVGRAPGPQESRTRSRRTATTLGSPRPAGSRARSCAPTAVSPQLLQSRKIGCHGCLHFAGMRAARRCCAAAPLANKEDGVTVMFSLLVTARWSPCRRGPCVKCNNVTPTSRFSSKCAPNAGVLQLQRDRDHKPRPSVLLQQAFFCRGHWHARLPLSWNLIAISRGTCRSCMHEPKHAQLHRPNAAHASTRSWALLQVRRGSGERHPEHKSLSVLRQWQRNVSSQGVGWLHNGAASGGRIPRTTAGARARPAPRRPPHRPPPHPPPHFPPAHHRSPARLQRPQRPAPPPQPAPALPRRPRPAPHGRLRSRGLPAALHARVGPRGRERRRRRLQARGAPCLGGPAAARRAAAAAGTGTAP
jgi:hypothetical protein